MKKSWHLNRREFLHGTGIALALPFLHGMTAQAKTLSRPRRFAAVYFPYGVSLPTEDHEHANWTWFPQGEGRDFQFNDSLKSLEPLRDQVTIMSGLSHPHGRRMGGHDTSDIFLTGAELKGSRLKNSISLDQVAASQFGEETRYPSLSLSTDGGVGEATRASTLSFGRTGQPIPAQHQPRQVFDRLFGVNADSKAAQRRRLTNSGSMLDLVRENTRSLRRRLGREDQQKLDEYLSSVRQIEQRVERSERWLDIPNPKVDASGMHLDASDEMPRELIRTMYDLMALAFQTDSTRYATYQIGNMNGATSIAGKFPALLGLGQSMHKLAHGWNKQGGAEALGKWDEFLAQQFTYFIERLKNTPDGDASLLDHTILLYGSSNSRTHNNTNYPIMLAGGKGLGMKHGQYLKLNEQTPFANVHTTILNRLGVPTEKFADANGELTQLLT
ncbi:MAG: DUF1552 domain-containing protein [Verrucomicrobiia bacterium]|jgi:hypothetical protein